MSRSLERFAGKSGYANHGQRVVAGQRLMQATSDIFLGWDRITDIDGTRHDYYFRQFRDWKGSVEIDSLRPAGLAIYARLCGWTLARAHARSGDRVAIAVVPRASPTPSTRRSLSSPWPTRTRTSATTRRCRQPSSKADSQRKRACRSAARHPYRYSRASIASASRSRST